MAKKGKSAKSKGKPSLPPTKIGPKIDSDIGVGQWIETGEWVDVKSSNVARIMYEGATKQLVVQFLHGGTYAYSVPPSVAKSMYGAPSQGKFVHKKLIAGGYPYTKIG